MKRSTLRPMSEKMAAQKRLEAELKRRMIEKHGARCMNCGIWVNAWRKGSLQKHEIISRSLGGDPLDEENVILICRACHEIEQLIASAKRRPKSEYPYVKVQC